MCSRRSRRREDDEDDDDGDDDNDDNHTNEKGPVTDKIRYVVFPQFLSILEQ